MCAYGDQEKTGKKKFNSTLEVSVGMGQSRLLILFFKSYEANYQDKIHVELIAKK